jgi:hypothetical protein
MRSYSVVDADKHRWAFGVMEGIGGVKEYRFTEVAGRAAWRPSQDVGFHLFAAINKDPNSRPATDFAEAHYRFFKVFNALYARAAPECPTLAFNAYPSRHSSARIPR